MKANRFILPLLAAIVISSCSEPTDVVTGHAMIMRQGITTPVVSEPTPAPAPIIVPEVKPTPAPVAVVAAPAPTPAPKVTAAPAPKPMPKASPVAQQQPTFVTPPPVARTQTTPTPAIQQPVCPTTGRRVYPVMPGQNRGLRVR